MEALKKRRKNDVIILLYVISKNTRNNLKHTHTQTFPAEPGQQNAMNHLDQRLQRCENNPPAAPLQRIRCTESQG